jgi:hypothetical protein
VLPASPALPAPGGTIEGCHDAGITPATIIPLWNGDRLDLDHAIHAAFAHAAYQARQREKAAQAGSRGDQPAAPVAVGEPEGPAWRPTLTKVNFLDGLGKKWEN